MLWHTNHDRVRQDADDVSKRASTDLNIARLKFTVGELARLNLFTRKTFWRTRDVNRINQRIHARIDLNRVADVVHDVSFRVGCLRRDRQARLRFWPGCVPRTRIQRHRPFRVLSRRPRRRRRSRR